MKLNKDTKHIVQIGDVLSFGDEQYLVKNVMRCTDKYMSSLAVSYTIQNIAKGWVIYSYPSSKLYGAEIIRSAVLPIPTDES